MKIQNTAFNKKLIFALFNKKLIFALMLIGIFSFAATTKAATYTVTTTADSGAGSLRAMVTTTNAAPTGSADTINFVIPANDTGCINGVCTITLTGEIAIQKIGSSKLTISGTGAGNLILSGNNTNRIFTFSSGGGGSSVTLNGVKVINCKAAYGGAIFSNAGNFIVSNSVFTNNTATGGGVAGGAVYLTGASQTMITNSTFSNNSALSGYGGAIAGGNIIKNSIITNNAASEGGGIFNASQISNSIISNNTAGYGGGIAIVDGSSHSISNSTLSGNTTTAYGAAIYQQSGDVTITNTTITNNTSSNGDGGGMFIDRGSFYFTNCTISNNSSKYNGGGIYAYTANVYNSKFLNTIVSGNTSTNTTSKDYYGPFQSLGYNILSDGTDAIITGTLTGNQVGTTAAPVDAKLAPLAYNGGFGLTRSLMNTSPAINAGTATGDATNVVPALDQRGASRVGATDIGAYEANNSVLAQTLPSGYTVQYYNSQIVPDSGNFTYLVTAGMLPPGLVLSPNAGGTVTLTGTPTLSGIYNFTVTGTDGVNTTTTTYSITILSLSPTAADVSIGGQVLNFKGRGIANARLTLTDGNGEVRTAMSNPFGYYRFANVEAGQTCIISVQRKGYYFSEPSRVVTLTGDLTDFNFTALPSWLKIEACSQAEFL